VKFSQDFVEDLALLQCDTVLLGKWFLTFQKLFLGLLDFRDEGSMNLEMSQQHSVIAQTSFILTLETIRDIILQQTSLTRNNVVGILSWTFRAGVKKTVSSTSLFLYNAMYNKVAITAYL
jgi:hypothetical protein